VERVRGRFWVIYTVCRQEIGFGAGPWLLRERAPVQGKI